MLVERGASYLQIVEHARVGVQLLVLILREVIRLGVVAQYVFARRERLGARQQLDQRGFARAVHAHQRHAVAALDDEIHAAENRFVAIALGHVLELRHDAPAGLGLRKREVDGLLFGGQFDALDPFQFLDAALHLLGFGGLVAEAVDEGFQLLDAVALVAIGGFQLRRRSGFCARYFS